MNSELEQARDWFFQGIAHFEAGRFEPARAAFESALSLAPGRPSVVGNLGITLFHLDRYEECMPLLQQATAADPDFLEAWTYLGACHRSLARWQDAVDALAQAIRLSPANATLFVRQGECLLRLGRTGEALQAFERAVAAEPGHAEAWNARGGLLRELHQLDEAARCFEKALALGADPELTGYYLASVQAGTAVPAPPRRYVESLFDDYATEFQSHVIGQLRYEGHERLLRPLMAGERTYRRALELGCGTGLCGPLVRPHVAVLDGVDISQAMLKEAAKLGIYRELIHADIGSYLQSAAESADLVIAADVFIYVGELTDIFHSVRKLLVPGGQFAFTVEACDNNADVRLLPSLRYAHSERYIRSLAETCGFKVAAIQSAPIRYEQERALAGMYVYLV